MAEITRDLEPTGEPNAWYQGVIKELARQLLSDQEECVIFLGAGAAFDASKKHLPTGKMLSQSLAKECHLEWHEYIPLSTIAFYYEFYFKRKALNRTLKDAIADPSIEPSTTIEKLMAIIDTLEKHGRDVLVITTNYDQHFERAYERRFGRPPGVIIYNGGTDANDKKAALHVGLSKDPRAWRPRSAQTYLYKMHGCISAAEDRNLVVTEEDYINFLSNSSSYDPDKSLLQYVLGKISDSSVLFIGYSLTDWNFRVIFKATAEKHAKSGYAVQYYTADPMKSYEMIGWRALVEFWGQKNVDIINVDAALFVEDLATVLRELASTSTLKEVK